MSDYWEAWWAGGDLYDRRTRAEVEAVRASESRARSRLASQMRQQQGDLQGQIDRLTEAFVALAEYEDIRGELTEYADTAACRKYAREVVPTVVVTGGAGLDTLPPPPEVRDYWLSWAARGLVATVTDAPDGSDGPAQLTRAEQCDPRRTAHLLVLIDAMRREHRFATPERLDTVLPTSAEITAAGRALWVAIADDRLGEDATRLLEERLRGLLGTPDTAAVEAFVRGLVPTSRDVALPAQAALTLQALHRLVHPDTSPSRPPSSDTDRDTDRGTEDPLAEAVRSLVDEGAPGEDAILARMTEVRARMGFVEERPTDDHWDATCGSVLDLLLDDLGGAPVPEGRRALAVRLLAPSLAPVVETLRTEAHAVPAPRTVHLGGQSVEVGADGVDDPAWRGRLETRVREQQATSPLLRPTAYGALVVAVLSLVLVVTSPAWLVLTIGAGALGGVLLLTERRSRREGDDTLAQRLRRADDDVAHATTEQRAEHERAQAAAAEADELAAEVAGRLQALAATPGRHTVV